VPRNAGAGQRDFAVESIYEYGSRVGAVRLLALLRRRVVRATAFAAAQALERNPPVGWYSRWMRSSRTRRLLLAHGGFRYDARAEIAAHWRGL
jgi:allantoinase